MDSRYGTSSSLRYLLKERLFYYRNFISCVAKASFFPKLFQSHVSTHNQEVVGKSLSLKSNIWSILELFFSILRQVCRCLLFQFSFLFAFFLTLVASLLAAIFTHFCQYFQTTMAALFSFFVAEATNTFCSVSDYSGYIVHLLWMHSTDCARLVKFRLSIFFKIHFESLTDHFRFQYPIEHEPIVS